MHRKDITIRIHIELIEPIERIELYYEFNANTLYNIRIGKLDSIFRCGAVVQWICDPTLYSRDTLLL